MTGLGGTAELRFQAPGPGSWALDPVHFPRPVTRYWAETQPAAFSRGTSHFARLYGMLHDGLQTSYINGFAYGKARPVPDEEIPGRLRRAGEVFAEKPWRQQLREWDEECKPTSIAAHRAIQEVDPEALPDPDLAAYLVRCRDHHAEMIFQHMRFTASAVLPTGDFLAHVGEWTGLPPSELLGLMRGAAPVSAGASAQLERLISGVRRDSAALALLQSQDGDSGAVLAGLRAIEGEAGAAVSGYLDLVGYRLLDGFDICEPTALEMPDVLLRAMRVAVEGESPAASDVADRIAEVRSKVPPAQQREFDELLGEARLTYRLRDERGVYSDIWASGLMRRAVLAAGRRLERAGRVHAAVHLVDASLDEMCAVLSGSAAPPADVLAERASYRATHNARQAPAVLGDPPTPPPDPAGLPPGAGRLMRAFGITTGALFGSSQERHEEHLLRGFAASRGVYEGPARRVSGPSEFDRIGKGDVLVTEATSEAFNILLPLLGAIVTDSGGLLSHSALVAREYGIPGVVGTREATARIADGARVRVDGNAGEVTVLG